MVAHRTVTFGQAGIVPVQLDLVALVVRVYSDETSFGKVRQDLLFSDVEWQPTDVPVLL